MKSKFTERMKEVLTERGPSDRDQDRAEKASDIAKVLDEAISSSLGDVIIEIQDAVEKKYKRHIPEMAIEPHLEKLFKGSRYDEVLGDLAAEIAENL